MIVWRRESCKTLSVGAYDEATMEEKLQMACETSLRGGGGGAMILAVLFIACFRLVEGLHASRAPGSPG